ncbi:GDSL esterase/lipase At1g29670-like [Actinidia eriantha]|uniref:GDSL esterase/lipase At1g29670-like n=1 Tax=Actinidia eriantha TaxID=165200 RepID=UPI00258F7B6C|nr:GDSL esterase/lipase At1g29670-like [Actinidia eriantha]
MAYFMVLIISLLANLQPLVFGEPQVPCFFIFGDSLVDNGNNNNLVTTAKANYPPYGIDFSGGPTGRFSNGQNMADILAQLLGFNMSMPPFATATDVLMGVNYGSGGAGIRDESGSQLGARISLNKQLLNHGTTVARIGLQLGNKEAAATYLSKCLYFVGMGSNDYINNYLMPQFYPTSTIYTPQQYARALIQQYKQQLVALYEYGARKVALPGLGLIGCTPAEVATYGATNGSACVDSINEDVQLFNNELNSLIHELNNDFSNAKFVYVNITEISLGDPSAAGITVINAPCCIVLSNVGKGQCAPNQVPCNNRNTYVFWDGYHPTAIANVFLAAGAYIALTPLISVA